MLSASAAEDLSLPSGDLVAPKVKHSPITKEIPSGEATNIRAKVTDNIGVQSVILFYRDIGNSDFKRMQMKRELGSDNYAATLPKATAPGLEYYIQATDRAGNTILHGHSFSPLAITVSGAAPPEEDTIALTPKPAKKKISKWVWIGLGAVVLGAAAAAGGGGSSSSDDPAPLPTGTLAVSAPTP